MTTNIKVIVKTDDSLLERAKLAQQVQRDEDEEKREEKLTEKEIAEEDAEAERLEYDDQKGAVADTEKRKKRINRGRKRKCGFWIFKDYLIGRPDYAGEGTLAPEERNNLSNDTFQLSIGTGDGRRWATHYFEGPGGKPSTATNVTGSQTFIGYLSYVQFYTGGFGTVYELPEGATVVPYDPVVYLNPSVPAGICPNNFCWALFFPDELGSMPGVSRKNVTVVTKGKPINQFEPTVANQAIFNFPINNRKTIVVAANWLGWSMGTAGEIYGGVYPEEYFLHPEDNSKPSIRRTVYYKYPGGVETGWQPIFGYYWLMDPESPLTSMNLTRLNQLFPLDDSIIHNYQGQEQVEVVGFAVGPSKVKKLDSIPPQVAAKVRARCPAPFWDDSNVFQARWNFRDVVDNIPGYPEQIDEIYNNASWEMNPDAHCMGIGINLFYRWTGLTSATDLPYDYWNRDEAFTAEYPERGSVMTKQILGASPGIYDSYELDLQDHAFYNHFGKGAWYDSWGFTYSTKDSWLSDFGDVRIHAGDIRKDAWEWMKNIRQTKPEGSPPQYITKNDLAWLYLRPNERTAFIDNYRDYDFTSVEINYLNSAPEDPIFHYIYYQRSVDDGKLVNGVKWITDGYGGAWADPDLIEFDDLDDPFYQVPYMDVEDEHWKKYKLKTRLSKNRTWPPSISAGFTDPIPSDVDVSSKGDHPLARGGINLSYVINTAWGNDYSQVLLSMGFESKDLAV